MHFYRKYKAAFVLTFIFESREKWKESVCGRRICELVISKIFATSEDENDLRKHLSTGFALCVRFKQISGCVTHVVLANFPTHPHPLSLSLSLSLSTSLSLSLSISLSLGNSADKA